MNILVAEDEAMMREGIMEFLKESGYQVFGAEDGRKALAVFEEKTIHLAVLDMMMPGKSGLEVLKEIRKKSDIPVLILTAVSDELVQVQSFDEKADDYMTKPFSLVLLKKRIEALLRRKYSREDVWSWKEAVVDFKGFTATYQGEDANVKPKEIKVLAILLEHKGQTLTREQILDLLWGDDENAPFDRVIDVYVKNLRQKLHLDCLVTVKGVGYKVEL